MKDEEELKCIKRAAYLAATVLEKSLVAKMEQVIDEGKQARFYSYVLSFRGSVRTFDDKCAVCRLHTTNSPLPPRRLRWIRRKSRWQ